MDSGHFLSFGFGPVLVAHTKRGYGVFGPLRKRVHMERRSPQNQLAGSSKEFRGHPSPVKLGDLLVLRRMGLWLRKR